MTTKHTQPLSHSHLVVKAMLKQMKDKIMTRAPYIAFASALVAFDQLSKWAITELFLRPKIFNGYDGLDFGAWLMDAPERLPYHEVALAPFFNIVMVWNQGVSFGMLAQGDETGKWILVALTAIITIWFSIWLFFTRISVQKFAIAMVIGGAIGNVIDRLRFGAVIDFLDFHAFGLHYPAFNLADSCIVLGVFILIFYALFFEKTVQD